MESLLPEPALFDTYIAIDPSLWWNDERLVRGGAASLRDLQAAEKTVSLASGGEKGVAEASGGWKASSPGMPPGTSTGIIEKMPDEEHSTIFHPAASRAFRAAFKPADAK